MSILKKSGGAQAHQVFLVAKILNSGKNKCFGELFFLTFGFYSSIWKALVQILYLMMGFHHFGSSLLDIHNYIHIYITYHIGHIYLYNIHILQRFHITIDSLAPFWDSKSPRWSTSRWSFWPSPQRRRTVRLHWGFWLDTERCLFWLKVATIYIIYIIYAIYIRIYIYK